MIPAQANCSNLFTYPIQIVIKGELHSTLYIHLGKEAHTWQTIHSPLYYLTVWIAGVIYVLCWSTILIPVDLQIHSVNLH